MTFGKVATTVYRKSAAHAAMYVHEYEDGDGAEAARARSALVDLRSCMATPSAVFTVDKFILAKTSDIQITRLSGAASLLNLRSPG